MAARQVAGSKLFFLISTVLVLVLLIVFVWGSGRLHEFSYAKILPVSIEFSAQVNADQQLRLEYDYGYGFNQAHSQTQFLIAETVPQTIRYTVSAWKTPIKVRLIASAPKSLSLASTTVQQGPNVLRLLSSADGDSPAPIVVTIDKLPELLAGGN